MAFQMTSRDTPSKSQFRNSSSLMHFYHNGTFNYKQMEPYNPQKYRDSSTTDRNSSHETFRKKRFQRESSVMKMVDRSPERRSQKNLSKNPEEKINNKVIKGEALDNYIGYLQNLVERLKGIQKEQLESKTSIDRSKDKVALATQIKKRPSTSPIQNEQTFHERSTSKKQILHSLIDQTKRQNSAIKLNDIRDRYKHMSVYAPDNSKRRLQYESIEGQNLSSIQKRRMGQSESFISDAHSEFRIREQRKTAKKEKNILDLVDLDPKEIKNLTKRDNLKRQVLENWGSRFPKGFFDHI